jgi:hypothetical protein
VSNGAKLADGTEVDDVFDEIRRELDLSGYEKKWVDGWERSRDGAVVSCGYSYREVRVRRYLPGHKERSPQAVLDVKKEGDLAKLTRFVDPPAEDWTLLDEIDRQIDAAE